MNWYFLIVLFAFLFGSQQGFASDNRFYLSPGISASYSEKEKTALGLEASAIYQIPFYKTMGEKMEIPPYFFFGLVGEGIYYFDSNQIKWLMGGELGLLLHDYPCLLFGADAGFAFFNDKQGYSIRPFIAFPYFPFLLFYYRYNHIHDFSFSEYGFLIKIPINLQI